MQTEQTAALTHSQPENSMHAIAQDFTAAPMARTCSDERMCINCFANQGECLGPYKHAVPTDGQIDAITQEWAGSIEVPRLRLELCREYARRILKAFAAAQPVARADHCQGPECRDGIRHASDCAVHNEPAFPAGPCDCEAGS